MGKAAKDLGTYIVADPAVCDGQPTFRGTHTSVDEVLRQLATGKPRDAIAEASRGKLSAEAIAEAVHLATEALFEAHPKNEGPDVRELGKYVIAHPGICHGHLTVRGSRVLVDGILSYVGKGQSVEENAREWTGSGITPEAVAEAIELARQALRQKAPALTTV